MKIVFRFIFIIISVPMLSQNNIIELPNVDGRVGLVMEPYIKLYVKKDNTIIFNQ